MSFRYKGAKLSNTAPTSYDTGLWTMRQQLQANTGSGPGSQYFQNVGTFSFVAPAGVTSVCVVCIGPTLAWANNAYIGRGGGGLGWKNNIAVTPGNSYTVVVGDSNNGLDSYFISTGTVKGGAATSSSTGGTYVGDGGGNGGDGGAGSGSGTSGAGGGGAGGYAGNGGNGGTQGANNGFAAATNSGGGGGGAGGTSGSFGGGGGGVSAYGIGTTGAGGIYSATSDWEPGGGRGGSYGNNGSMSNTGGGYGAASKGGGTAGTSASVSGGGYAGGVRIVWGGLTFPSNAV
jgi:hypothetical protein